MVRTAPALSRKRAPGLNASSRPAARVLPAATCLVSQLSARTRSSADFCLTSGSFLFGAALYVIYTELRGFRYADVVAYLRSIPPGSVGAACRAHARQLCLLTVYDWLGLGTSGLDCRTEICTRCGIGYSFSIALGHAYLTGGAVRYRLYSAWGFSGTDIARIIIFCGCRSGSDMPPSAAHLSACPLAIPDELRLPVSSEATRYRTSADSRGYTSS
jgi:hypothetical protein